MPKNNILKIMFLVTLAITLLVLAINYQFIYQSFNKVLIQGAEDEALRAARYLQGMFLKDVIDLKKDSFSDEFPKNVDMAKKDFRFTKLKVFSREGEIIYSTESNEIGEVNTKDYFHEIIAKGNNYSKLVKKDNRSLEDKVIRADVVETYIPVMREGSFIGAFEIYYDITKNYQKLNNAILYFSTYPSIMMLCFFIIISITIIRLDRSIIERKRVETELLISAEKLKTSNRELQEFVSIASHDLQEPLRKVTAFGGRIKSNYAEVLDEKGRDYLDRMINASKRMQDLINGLLAFSRVTTKAQPFIPVDLSHISKEVLSDLEVRIEQTGGRVEIGDLSTLEADPLQMRQLFQNLISNALKFHNQDNPPFVKITGTYVDKKGNDPNKRPSDEETYQIIIEDNGIGFDEKYAERIFGVFQRLHGHEEYEGTGIGLSVCKKIVERHGGSITAKSMLGKGTVFIVTLPLTHPV